MLLVIFLLHAVVALGHTIPQYDAVEAFDANELGHIEDLAPLAVDSVKKDATRRYKSRRHINDISKRELSDKDWTSYVGKGQSFLCLMKADVDSATKMMQDSGRPGAEIITTSQSQWKYSDLGKYGWDSLNTDYQTDFSNGGSQPIKTAMDALGLSTVGAENGGSNVGMLWAVCDSSDLQSQCY